MSTITLAPVRPAPRAVRATTAATSFAAGSARRPAGSVRLTRRGRVVVLLLAFLAVAAVAVSVAAGSAATREDGGTPTIEVVTVAPGETLWEIASDVAAATGGDVRGAMAEIEDLNALDGGLVYAGQQLRVPAVD